MWSSSGLDTWATVVSTMAIAIADYATVRVYANDTNMTFTACSIPELQHDMNMDLQFSQNLPIAEQKD